MNGSRAKVRASTATASGESSRTLPGLNISSGSWLRLREAPMWNAERAAPVGARNGSKRNNNFSKTKHSLSAPRSQPFVHSRAKGAEARAEDCDGSSGQE